MSATKHYNDWPNAGAFNALGDQKQKIKLGITGSFPDYAAGVLYRTGPGGYKIPRADSQDGDFACSHWFDGFVTTHRFELQHGKDGQCSEIWYSSCSQVDEAIEVARKTGRLEGITFAQKRDPCDTLYKKLKTVFEPVFDARPASANIGVTFREAMPSELPSAGSRKDSGGSAPSATDSGYDSGGPPGTVPSPRKVMLLTTDSATGKTFDADTLEPLGVAKQATLHPALKGQLSGAHASRDPSTGDMFNYNLELGPKSVYRIWRANASTGKVDILAEISDPSLKAAYIHSSFLTENYVILCVWCSFLQPYGVSVLWNRNILDSLSAFDKKSRATWLVIDRNGRGLVKKFTSPAFFSFHTTNAWEQEGPDGTTDIVCELVEFDNVDILHRFYYKNLVSDESNVSAFNKKFREEHRERLTRYRLSGISTSDVQPKYSRVLVGQAEKILTIDSPDAGDLQQCNPHYKFRAHRYSWGVRDTGRSSFVDGIVKSDTATRTALWWGQEKHTPGEPIFVPAPRVGAAEDEGVILTIVFDGEKGTSYLLCLDAATMQERGRAEVGSPVGLGFHGTHVRSSL
ncbi:Putative carotenoid oxygenase [Septoria linicola]|uniref:Carotenoid oxygenase n=1 Tax=Septoria linicola TaxID=215465 RepID=A0A9Q9AYN6_9PEZI|nr:Putative carotenoid oxygenase [Septoria linicola]